jgi:hypothetical protein
MLTEEEISRIQEYAREATGGPWEFLTDGARRAAPVLQQPGGRTVLYLDPVKNGRLDDATRKVDADMDFISRAREDLPRLADEVSHLTQVVTEMRLAFDKQGEDLSFLYQENLRLKEALEFYSELRTYRRLVNPETSAVTPAPIEKDLGNAARIALGLPPREEPPPVPQNG